MNVLAIIVLYECKLLDSVSFKCLKQQLDFPFKKITLYVYDNSSVVDEAAKGIVETIFFHFYYYHDSNNSGVSRAYNKAAEFAAEKGIQWLLLLDQDTLLPNNLLSVYFKSINEQLEISLFVPKIKVKSRGYMSPCIYRRKRGYFLDDVPVGKISSENYSVINSGMMISIAAFQKCGGYNELVFLDYSDHEFFSRYKRFYSNFYVIDVECLQDYACFSRDIFSLQKRYNILCKCVLHIPVDSLEDKWEYFVVLLRRSIYLTLLTKSVSFLKILYKNYIDKKV